MNLDWPRAREGARAELVLSGGSICERAQKSAHTNRHESPRFDHTHVGVRTWYLFDHTHVGVRTWYLAVALGVVRTPTRKNTSVERSETDENSIRANSSWKFQSGISICFFVSPALRDACEKALYSPLQPDFIQCAYYEFLQLTLNSGDSG